MLTGKQLRFLRAIGSEIDPVVQIGKAGINDQVVQSVMQALQARELIKIRVLQNCASAAKEVTKELADSAQAELVQVIGRNGLLYKKNLDKPKIELP